MPKLIAVKYGAGIYTREGSGWALFGTQPTGNAGLGPLIIGLPGGGMIVNRGPGGYSGSEWCHYDPVGGWTYKAAVYSGGVYGNSCSGCYLDPTHIYAIGNGANIEMFNGTSWVSHTTNAAWGGGGGGVDKPQYIFAISSSNIWATGRNGGNGKALFQYNGSTWTSRFAEMVTAIGLDPGMCGGVWAVDANNVYFAFGLGTGYVVKLANDTTWSIVGGASLATGVLNVYAADTGHIWAKGNGKVFYSTGGAFSTQISQSGVDAECVAIGGLGYAQVEVSFRDDAVDSLFKLWETFNLGTTWTKITSGYTPDGNSFSFSKITDLSITPASAWKDRLTTQFPGGTMLTSLGNGSVVESGGVLLVTTPASTNCDWWGSSPANAPVAYQSLHDRVVAFDTVLKFEARCFQFASLANTECWAVVWVNRSTAYLIAFANGGLHINRFYGGSNSTVVGDNSVAAPSTSPHTYRIYLNPTSRSLFIQESDGTSFTIAAGEIQFWYRIGDAGSWVQKYTRSMEFSYNALLFGVGCKNWSTFPANTSAWSHCLLYQWDATKQIFLPSNKPVEFS